jgi:hypothetical protein
MSGAAGEEEEIRAVRVDWPCWLPARKTQFSAHPSVRKNMSFPRSSKGKLPMHKMAKKLYVSVLALAGCRRAGEFDGQRRQDDDIIFVVRMIDEPNWLDLAEMLKNIKQVAEPLWADWLAYEGCEDYGIWLLRPEGTREARATFGLFAARAIEKLGIPPIPTPQPLQHFPAGRLYCDVTEEIVPPEGKRIDLSDTVPFGLGVVDRDAVDACTRGWLELLRRESAAFVQSSRVTLSIKGKG